MSSENVRDGTTCGAGWGLVASASINWPNRCWVGYRTILQDQDLRPSVHVLQEFYVQATRASRRDALSHDQAVGLVQSFLRFRPAVITKELVLAALDTCARFQIS